MAESLQAQILAEVRNLSVGQARIEGRIANVETASSKLMKIVVDGNGQPPLVDRVEEIERKHRTEAQKELDKKKTREKWDARTWAIVMLFIGQIVLLIFAVK